MITFYLSLKVTKFLCIIKSNWFILEDLPAYRVTLSLESFWWPLGQYNLFLQSGAYFLALIEILISKIENILGFGGHFLLLLKSYFWISCAALLAFYEKKKDEEIISILNLKFCTYKYSMLSSLDTFVNLIIFL